jgi:reductive dehalogenase
MASIGYVNKGASRYVEGDTAPFDQKNEMFKRPLWDPNFLEMGRKFYFESVMPRDKPGYELKDQALVNASWLLENDFAQGTRGGKMGLYSWTWKGEFDYPRVRPGLTIPDADPKLVTRDVKKAASLFGAGLVGVCEVDRRWLYSPTYNLTHEGGQTMPNELDDSYKYAVVLAVEMDYEAIGYAPAHPASAAAGMGYSKMAFAAGLLALYIRGLGYKAIPCGNDTACSIPMAIDAGLGELGRNGILVTPKYGPRVRLAKVFTDLELTPDRPIEFGVWEFCMICGKCAQKCPSQAIMKGEPSSTPHNISNREGVLAWHINAERCLSFWVKNVADCSNCIRVCPFNKPQGVLHEMVRWGIHNVRIMDRLFLWGDDFMGYGRQQMAEKFWEK